jgi:type II secretory pathway pseudopilin PulG
MFMPNRMRRAGISLLELMVAMGVIAVGLSGVAAALIFGVTKSNYGAQLELATNHSRTLVETIQGRGLVSKAPLDGGTQLPLNDSGVNDKDTDPPRKLTDPPFQDPTLHPAIDPEDLGHFTRKIQMKRRGGKGTTGENLVDVVVTIYWEEKGVEKSVKTTAVIQTPQSLP